MWRNDDALLQKALPFLHRGGQGFLDEGITTSGAQFVEQLIGSLAIAGWCAVVSLILFKLIDAMLGLRVSQDEETQGLDLTQHDERGY